MKALLIIVMLISAVGCKPHKSTPDGYDERKEILPHPEGYKVDTFYTDTAANKIDPIRDSVSKH